jgi:hypothetical protein
MASVRRVLDDWSGARHWKPERTIHEHPAVDRHDQAPSLSRDVEPEIEPLLREVMRRGWTLVCCGPRAHPDVLAAINRTQFWADVVVLRGPDRAAAYRTPARPHDNPLQPIHVTWHYLSDPERTLRAILNIPPAAATSAPYPIPDQCRIPEAQRRPLTIRLGRQVHP